ncbi:hypothetical protein [Bremerella sp. P1]|uniref:hypothetical protein n=1 Tax=Bremerella sp. P1 TaxID=3026424 RepID=UPI002368105E|nr:hypothetical protein [Bremerella sp. P1]WDI42058.1 hypothetical protein PSR63_26755 [Bremerella sp. P1]
MSHHHAPKPETHGAGSTEHAPQVAVRDGNRLVCPCCGEVLMYLSDDEPHEEPSPPQEPSCKPPRMRPSPWDEIARRQDALKEAAWQAYEQAQKAEQEQRLAQFLASDDPGFCADYLTQPIDPEVAAYEFPEEDPPELPNPKRARQTRTTDSATSRPRSRRRHDLPLEQPHTHQEKRYLAWTFYHLKLQDLELQEKIHAKQAKIDCLRRELGGVRDVPSYEQHLPSENVPKVRPHIEVVEFDLQFWIEQVKRDQGYQSYESTRLKTVLEQAKERGPPV